MQLVFFTSTAKYISSTRSAKHTARRNADCADAVPCLSAQQQGQQGRAGGQVGRRLRGRNQPQRLERQRRHLGEVHGEQAAGALRPVLGLLWNNDVGCVWRHQARNTNH